MFGYDEELPGGYQDADLEMREFEEAADDLDDDDLDDADQEQPAPVRTPLYDGKLYRYHDHARCDGCRQWWRKHVLCEYVEVRYADDPDNPYPYDVCMGQHVSDLSDWEKCKNAGSSFAVWTNYDWEKPEAIHCPDCRAARIAAAATMTLDLDAAPASTAADYTPDQAGHYDNPPEARPDPEEAIQRHLDAVLTDDLLAALDTQLGTVRCVEWLKARGVDPGPVPWNRLANNATGRACERKYRTPEPEPAQGALF